MSHHPDKGFAPRVVAPESLSAPAAEALAAAADGSPVGALVRRVADVLGAGAGMALAVPVLLPIGALAWLLDGRPLLYAQQRLGRDRKPFTLYKLRTMIREAEMGGIAWAEEDDPRVTWLGRRLRRYRIDELPQLLNVLKGDMSLVGPRPERPEFVGDLLNRLPHYDARFAVRPGLTGWAQVHYPYGASEADAREKLAYELYYLQHRSLRLDALVLLKTLPALLRRPGR